MKAEGPSEMAQLTEFIERSSELREERISPNPRDTLSDEALAEHVAELESVHRARQVRMLKPLETLS